MRRYRDRTRQPRRWPRRRASRRSSGSLDRHEDWERLGHPLASRLNAKLHAHADLHGAWIHLLDSAHHAKPLVEIDERDIVRSAVTRMIHRRRINRAETLAHPPF